MKTTKYIAALALAVLALVGCGRTPVANGLFGNQAIRVASLDKGDVFVINVSGEEYVVVLGDYKAAICPKTKPTLEAK